MSNIGMMEGAFFVGRGELLSWLNDLLQLTYTKVEQCANGAAYCQIMDSLYPGEVNMSKVNFAAKTEYEFVKNYKVLQQLFDKKKIEKHVEVDKLTKARPLDNLEFLQWTKAFWDRNHRDVEYKPTERRSTCGKENTAPNDTAVAANKLSTASRVKDVKDSAAASSRPQSSSAPSRPGAKAATSSMPAPSKAQAKSAATTSGSDTPKLQEMHDEVGRLKLIVEDLEKERDFYFGKLRDIEITCQANDKPDCAPMVEKIQEILYATTDDFVSAEEAER